MKTPNQIDAIIEKEHAESKVIKMIEKHRKHTGKLNLKPYPVPGDPCHTVFYCKDAERGMQKVSEYMRSHIHFWK